MPVCSYLPYCSAGHVAEKLEKDLGVPVLRHSEKKPAGGPEDLERHFGWAVTSI
jgi:Mitochondrial PGP phosphatase